MIQYILDILQGTVITLVFTIGAYVFGFFSGLVICTAMALRLRGATLCEWLCDVLRGTPIILQALIFQYLLGAYIPTMLLAIIIFGINSMAYSSQIMLSSVRGISTDQYEAGLSLGLSPVICYVRVVIPQAVRNAVPALLNEFFSLLKEGAIVGVIALGDLFSTVDRLGEETGYVLQNYIVAGCIYLGIALIVKKAVSKAQQREAASSRVGEVESNGK